MQRENKNYKETELDLGIFFNLAQKIYRKLVSFLSAFFHLLSRMLLWGGVFIKQKIVWIAIGTLLGFVIGLYRYFADGPAYYSDMIVKANFESGQSLYNSVDYLNSLIKQSRNKELAAMFGLQEQDAAGLNCFSIAPVDNYLETARLYKNLFLDYRRTGISKNDTLWAKTIKLDNFKSQLKPYDFPLQRIRLYSRNPYVYPKVQEGLMRSINSNNTLKVFKQNLTTINNEETSILQRSLSGIDSLRQAYIKKLERGSAISSAGGNVIIADTGFSNPEIELIDKEIMVKDEWIQARKKAVEEQDILQVYSDFNPIGIKVTVLEQQLFIRYALWGLLLAIALLLFVELFKYLNIIERRTRDRI